MRKIELFRFPTPTCYMTTPGFSGSSDLRKMTAADQKDLGYFGDEAVWVESKAELKTIQKANKAKPYVPFNDIERKNIQKGIAQVKALLKSNKSSQSFAWVDMRSENLGHTLAAVTPGGKRGDLIYNKGDLLFIYTGRLALLSSLIEDTRVIRKFFEQDFAVDAGKDRGVASWMQCAPEDPCGMDLDAMVKFQHSGPVGDIPVTREGLRKNYELFSLRFKKDVKPAKANTAVIFITLEHPEYGQVPVIACLAAAPIYYGQYILMDYGHTFEFENGKKYFDESGKIIPSHSYLRTHGYLRFNEHAYWGELTSLVKEVEKPQLTLTDENGVTFIVTGAELREQLIKVNAMFPVKKPVTEVDTPPTAIVPEATASVRDQGVSSASAALPSTVFPDFSKAIRNAAAQGKATELRELLTKNPHLVDEPDSNKDRRYTPLHWAMQNNNLNCAALLLQEFKANRDVTNAQGKKPDELATAVFVEEVEKRLKVKPEAEPVQPDSVFLPSGKS